MKPGAIRVFLNVGLSLRKDNSDTRVSLLIVPTLQITVFQHYRGREGKNIN